MSCLTQLTSVGKHRTPGIIDQWKNQSQLSDCSMCWSWTCMSHADTCWLVVLCKFVVRIMGSRVHEASTRSLTVTDFGGWTLGSSWVWRSGNKFMCLWIQNDFSPRFPVFGDNSDMEQYIPCKLNIAPEEWPSHKESSLPTSNYALVNQDSNGKSTIC